MSVISTATSAYANTSNLAMQRSVSDPITPEANKQAALATVSADNAPPSTTDVVVTLSAQAKNASKDVPLNNYAPLFAGRDNLPQSFALSNGVTIAPNINDPTAAGSQKSFGQVALDARASMDAQYAAMKVSGKPFDSNSWEGKDWNSVMGGLDRRSLYAVRSNEGGKFTKEEQDMAQSFMVQQQGLAMGLYEGPISKAGTFVSPFGSVSDGFKNGVKFLDNVSGEEKSSVEWGVARASAQITYESAAENERKVPEKLDSESFLAQVITAAMKAMKHHPSLATTTGWLLTADDLKRQPWFKSYESQLDQAMRHPQDNRANTNRIDNQKSSLT